MRYKVGERVRIKSLDWYNENNDGSGILSYKISGVPFTSDMAKYCGSIVTINRAYAESNSCLGDRYYIKEDDGNWVWHEKMFEGLVAEDDNPFDDNIPLPDSFVERMAHKIADSELFNVEPLDIPTMTTDFVKENGFPCPDGYEFRDENGNVIEAKKIVLEKKKPRYPKTENECLDAIPDSEYANLRSVIAFRLVKLLCCRNAYWKIADDWKPDWAMYSGPKHCIIYSDNEIKWQGKHFVTEAKVLAFPTEEMRDSFYENFKELIEECKELL